MSGQSHRGKGFTDIQYPARLHPRNKLSVISGRGHYRYSSEFGLAVAQNENTKYGGTLIQWDLHIPDDQPSASDAERI